MREISPKLHWAVLPLAAQATILPLVLHGASCGHDFDFHLQSWMEVKSQWAAGIPWPHWDFRAAWNAGEPRFLFYPPASWMLGALLGSFLPWTLVPLVFTWVALTLSGFTFLRLARAYASYKTSLVTACLFLINPYMLFTAYERTAYAELLAVAWMPWLLLEAMRPRIRIVPLALPLALLWLTNAPAAVIGSYTLAWIGIARLLMLWRRQEHGAAWKLLASGVAAVLLGLGYASAYLFPVLHQRKHVTLSMAVVEGLRPVDNFLYHHTSDALHDEVLHTASTISLLILLPALLCAALVLLRRRDLRAPAALCAGLVAVFLFLLTPASLLVWQHAPQLAFLQFPWRFDAMGSVVTALLLAMLLEEFHLNQIFALASIAVLIPTCSFAASHSLYQVCDDEDNPTAQRASFLRDLGSSPTDEYTPEPDDEDALQPDRPRAWLAPSADGKPGTTSQQIYEIFYPNPSERYFYLPQPTEPFLIVNLRNFSGWNIFSNGHEVLNLPERADGLIVVPVIPGQPKQIHIYYRWTKDRYAGVGLSFLLVFLTAGVQWFRRENLPKAVE